MVRCECFEIHGDRGFLMALLPHITTSRKVRFAFVALILVCLTGIAVSQQTRLMPMAPRTPCIVFRVLIHPGAPALITSRQENGGTFGQVCALLFCEELFPLRSVRLSVICVRLC